MSPAAALWQWFNAEMRALCREPAAPGRSGVLMGCPIWGAAYIARFGRFCLPTIASPQNLKALGAAGCRTVVFTDAAGVTPLLRMLGPLHLWGFDAPVIRVIPAEVMGIIGRPNMRYLVLAVVQHLLVQMAARWGMGFHMLMPDHCHGPTFFANLIEIGQRHHGIVQTSISADIATAAADIEAYRQPDGELTIPDRDLGDIGWRHLHPQMLAYLMNHGSIPDRLPNSHFLMWQGRDRLSIYCCHMNPVWLSRELCAAAPLPDLRALLLTIDQRLPSLMRGNVYVPGVDDGMTFIELSDGGKAFAPDFVPFDSFGQRCWQQVNWRDDWMPFFREVCEVPIHPRPKFAPEGEIRTQHAYLIERLLIARPRLALEYAREVANRPLRPPKE